MTEIQREKPVESRLGSATQERAEYIAQRLFELAQSASARVMDLIDDETDKPISDESVRDAALWVEKEVYRRCCEILDLPDDVKHSGILDKY